MRQVPQKASYTLVGNGRLARHLAYYFSLLHLKFQTWKNGDLGEIPPADRTLLLISDRAIEPFIGEHQELNGRRLIHASGSLVTTLAESVHPLMTFSNDLYDLATYQAIPLISESSENPLPDLPNPCYQIPADDRSFYHALCVLSGNFTVLLWQKLFSELKGRWNIPAPAAFPYLRQIARNLERGQALTGPLARGDHATVAANLHSLNLENDAYESVYRSFVNAFDKREVINDRP